MIDLNDFIIENHNGRKVKKYHIYCDRCDADRGYQVKSKVTARPLCKSCSSKDRTKTPEARQLISQKMIEYHAKWKEEHPNHKEEYNKKRRGNRIKEPVWKRCRREVKHKDKKYPEGSRYDFTDEEIQKFLQQSCFYCGDTENIGLDRIDNSIGHCKSNCLPCCALCNLTRGNRYTVEEFKKIGVIIKQIKDDRLTIQND